MNRINFLEPFLAFLIEKIFLNSNHKNPFLLDRIFKLRFLHDRFPLLKKSFNIYDNFLNKWLKRASAQLNPKAKSALIKNIILKSAVTSVNKRKEFEKRYGFYPPQHIVISVTARCNLNCKGCWAHRYRGSLDMPLEFLQRIINECREIGIHFITITGGEPFIRKDLFEIYKRNQDMFFHIYTNGTLIGDKEIKILKDLGNVGIMISVEGFKEITDKRRGKGVFEKIISVMESLKKEGITFGYSVTTTRENVYEVTSQEFVEFMVERGCLVGWYFNYVPIGHNPNPDLMPTPSQRDLSRRRIYELRKKYPILLADFWNDGPSVGGCMAGGKRYLHINVNGDVEPCVFCHFAVDNLKEKSLVEVLNSEFFTEIRKNIPYDGNTLRSCMIIDRPQVLREYLKKYPAYPTHPGAESLVKDENIVRALDEYSAELARIYDEAWRKGDWEKIFSFFGDEKEKKIHSQLSASG